MTVTLDKRHYATCEFLAYKFNPTIKKYTIKFVEVKEKYWLCLLKVDKRIKSKNGVIKEVNNV